MRLRPRPPWLRRNDGGELLEWLLVSAVASVLVIRWFLVATGYPRVGSGGLHIAHLLWGGLFMLVALVLLLRFLDPRVNRVAAVLAGLGFGAFVDELGKYITADNDYLYRPAVALIYLVFVALFLVVRALSSDRPLTSSEAVANAMEIASGDVEGPMEAGARSAALRMLALADRDDPLVLALRSWLRSRPTVRRDDSLPGRLAHAVEAASGRLSRRPELGRLLAGIMVLDVTLTVLGTATLVLALRTDGDAYGVSSAGQALSAIVGGLLVLRGLPDLASSRPESRLEAMRWFRRGVLVWILVTQVFAFYISQLAALAGLGAHVATYAALTFLLAQEGSRRHAAEADEESNRPTPPQ